MSRPTSPVLPGRGSLPLVIQTGFAGARELYDRKEYPDVDPRRVEEAVQSALEALMSALPAELGVQERPYFFCGLSQLAIGGDALFTRACVRSGWLQRVFLPQHWEEYLAAKGSEVPDFSEEQKQIARALRAGPQVIQERVVSDAPDRHDRFHDVSLELVRESDLLICLLPARPKGKKGGTLDLITLARKRQRAVIALQVRIDSEAHAPIVTRHWHGREDFHPPTLPAAVAGAGLPDSAAGALPGIEPYCNALRHLSAGPANRERTRFKWAALTIIAAHVLATICATVALKLHAAIIPWLLGVELLLLATSFTVHQVLHVTHSLERWALFRLVAEVKRSVTAIGRFHVHLEHLFDLPFPVVLRPLLRTVNVLHLYSNAHTRNEPWEPQRDAYVKRRLTERDEDAQIPYNQKIQRSDGRGLTAGRWVFLLSSGLAFGATLVKLLTIAHGVPVGHARAELVASVMGALAIVLPVVAVASLSLVAGFDLEARLHTSKEMVEFLDPQAELLAVASTAREYSQLLIETESRLLGETVNWYARRSFLGVA